MSPNRIAYLLACVLMAPATIATASAEPGVNPVDSPLAPCFAPNLQNDHAPRLGDEFLRALNSMSLTGDQRVTIENLSAAYCGALAQNPAPVALRSDEVSFHDDIKGVLEPAQRAELDDRVAQLRVEDRVVGSLVEDGTT